MRLLLFIFFVTVLPISLRAQTFTTKTNSIKLNFKKADANTVLPLIEWVSPVLEYTNSQRNVFSIEVNVTSEVALKQIKFSVTDREKNVKEKLMESDPDTFSENFKQPLILSNGPQTLKITAININGGEVSSSRIIFLGIDAVADALSTERKNYALLFATDEYDNFPKLENPISDAYAIAAKLKNTYGFEIEIIENANKVDVLNKIADYTQRKYKSNDQLMIFFAGNGYFDEGRNEGFIITKNSIDKDPEHTSFLSQNRVRYLINNIPCQHIFLAMDVCYDGKLFPVVTHEKIFDYTESTQSQVLVRNLSYKTRKYLSTGNKTYTDNPGTEKHSPFSSKIIMALKGFAGGDRILTLAELKNSVEILTPPARFGGFGNDNPASDFVFVAKSN